MQFPGFPVEGVHDLPGGHGQHIHKDEGAHDEVELVVLHDLLVQLDVGEDGVDPPGLAEHGPEGEGEAAHQDPRPAGADVGEGLDRGHVGVQAEEDDRGVGQDAPDDDQVVHVRGAHLDLPAKTYASCFKPEKAADALCLPLVSVNNVEDEETGGQEDAEPRDNDDGEEEREGELEVLDLLDGPVLGGPTPGRVPDDVVALLEVEGAGHAAVLAHADGVVALDLLNGDAGTPTVAPETHWSLKTHVF